MDKATRELKAILFHKRAKGRMASIKVAFEKMEKTARRTKTLFGAFFFVLGIFASWVFHYIW